MGKRAEPRMSYKTYLSGTSTHAYGYGYRYGYPYGGHRYAYPTVEEMKAAREAEEARMSQAKASHDQALAAEQSKYAELVEAEKKQYESSLRPGRKRPKTPTASLHLDTMDIIIDTAMEDATATATQGMAMRVTIVPTGIMAMQVLPSESVGADTVGMATGIITKR